MADLDAGEGAQRFLNARLPVPFPMTTIKRRMSGIPPYRNIHDLQHIRAFVAVAREGNLTRAAQLLHLTQSAVSLQLKSFQDQLNLRLLTRSPRGLTLTTDGAKLLPYAEGILHAIGDFEAAAGNMLTTLSGAVSVGTILNPQTIRLGAILQYMAGHYPDVRTRLRHAMTGQVLDQIRSGTLDAGFYLGMPSEIDGIEFYAVALMPITYYVIAPKGWQERINGRGWTELAALPWIWTPETSTHHRLLAHAFGEAGVHPQIAAEVDLEASMVELVRAGVGLSLARESVAIDEAQKYGVAISREVPIEIPLSFITQARRKEEPLIEAIFLAAQTVFA